ncbi:uncharacterized protein LOC103495828 [Cucumis melo]|uniref:Uncharacterized protein LOC103495828 n=2 Tax=Cucumis melo TaxID=3656 RepID=A0ABM3L584_CUCME|nr:uncharacterized protein LOC103495828 [Cucumis melo]
MHEQSRTNKVAKLLDKSSLTIIIAGPTRLYNDNTSSLRNMVSQSILWSYSRKHTLEVANSFRRPLRMRIIRCWNFSHSPSERVLNHSMRTRYVKKIWVNDQATQKVWVGYLSPSPARVVLAVLRPHLSKLKRSNKLKS